MNGSLLRLLRNLCVLCVRVSAPDPAPTPAPTPDPEGEAITPEGLVALKAELGELETVARRDIARRILTAREHGDLKENAEYHAAKEDQTVAESLFN